MAGANKPILFYSERKVALEVDLTSGEFSLPETEGEPQYPGIEIEDYHESPHFYLISYWEGNLKARDGFKRVIWLPVTEAEKKTKDESLTFLKENYREIISPKGHSIGIATKEECRQYDLNRKKVYPVIKGKDGKILVEDKENSLSGEVFLGESPLESAYRLLKEKGTLSEMSIVNKNNKKNTITTGYIEETLTFINKNNLDFLDKEEFLELDLPDEVKDHVKRTIK
ncbi:MAG: hypothetical protein ACQEP1_02160 [Nanobdellota archaeon]